MNETDTDVFVSIVQIATAAPTGPLGVHARMPYLFGVAELTNGQQVGVFYNWIAKKWELLEKING